MIHYHGTPMSGGDSVAVKVLQGRHAMVSYAFPEPLPVVAEVCQSFTLDNGAFSTWKSGKPYDMDGYAEWVSAWCKHPGFDWYLLPDSIDGADEENNSLRCAWCNRVSSDVWSLGVPVWHLHESLDTLQYFTVAYSRVAFGSSGQFAEIGTPQWWTRMAEAMEVVCDEGVPRVKLHGLRMLDPTIFSHFPFSSADSTNVARNIGIDQRWKGTYPPKSKHTRALILMERIEQHAAASRWVGTAGPYRNGELFG